MKALLIVAHGSRNTDSVAEIVRLTDRVKQTLDQFDMVSHAFLELAKPDIPGRLLELIETGAKEIVILPYFLARGNHVVSDIPAEINKALGKHGDVSITCLRHIGDNDAMVGFISEHVIAQHNPRPD